LTQADWYFHKCWSACFCALALVMVKIVAAYGAVSLAILGCENNFAKK
jgi:hypothetical protein